MEDYEISEARNRRRVVPPLINVELKTKPFVSFIISNPGVAVAQDVQFGLPEGMSWSRDTGSPSVFKNGTKYFPPGRTFIFFYDSYTDPLKEENSAPKRFEINVSYIHPELNQRLAETSFFDLLEFKEAINEKTEIEVMTKSLARELKNLVGEVKKVGKNLESISAIASSTGLDLSVKTVENLRHIANQDGQIKKLNPLYCGVQVFVEVLRVSREVGWRFAEYFSGYGEAQSVTRIEGATEEILKRFKHHFIWIEVQKPPPNKPFSVSITSPKGS